MGGVCCADGSAATPGGDVEPVNAVALALDSLPDAVLPLRVCIVKVKGLPGAEAGSEKAALYCTCQLAGKPTSRLQTARTGNSVWNHEFQIDRYSKGDSLEFQVFGDEASRRGKSLGRAVLNPDRLKSGFSGHLPLLEAGQTAYLTVKVTKSANYLDLSPEPVTVHDANEFKVVVKKTDGLDKIGIDIVPQGANSLRVKRIKDGLIREWNARNPGKEVVPGHFVVGVNGTRGSADDILRIIGRDTTLEIIVLRLGSPSVK
mmetsp:Transcript_53512/g.120608  ORF Transcript_53512/g.120608 Transcript_53512/m.120608 type:complete len:260 (+) Transcript_53512:109-888(+)